MIIERFAPSPTGLLHLGHAYSALVGWRRARAAGGRYLLRSEDLDTARVRAEYETAMFADLTWLGIDWDGPVLHQASRQGAYDAALAVLTRRGLTYPCTCTRRDIAAAMTAPQEGAPLPGVYPGTCRQKARTDAPHAVRLNMARALTVLDDLTALGFDETGPLHPGHHALNAQWLIDTVGDFVIARRDGATAYHLAVVVDDAHQGVTHVTRGADLFDATPIHRLLQALLGLPTPIYHHHDLVRDETGKRLAKRDDARAIRAYRAAGLSRAEVIALAGLPPA